MSLKTFRRAAIPFVAIFAAGLAAANLPPGFPPMPKDYSPAGLGPREAGVTVPFPGSARARGIVKGSAKVAVLVDASGKGTDFLLVSCTDPSFGSALLDAAKTLTYQPARFKGSGVPARFDLAYEFGENDTSTFNVNVMDETRLRLSGDQKPTYTAVSENKLDRDLEFTNAVLPVLPDDVHPADQKPVKVFVTFFIDEEGRVRAPNVESAAAASLIPAALAAVQQWSFKPAMVKGKPALVYTGRPVRFVPASR